MGQDQARSGQASQISGQLDRIESNTKLITELMPGVRDRPPPLPSKDGDSPPPSPTSSTSSIETARPVTPPPYMSADSVQRQFDDMRNLLGTLIGRTNDLAEAVSEPRQYDLTQNGQDRIGRMERMLERALSHLSDSMIDDLEKPSRYPAHRGIPPVYPKAPSISGSTVTGSFLSKDIGGVYDDEAGLKAPAPPNSDAHSGRDSQTWSPIPDSLLEPIRPGADFDPEFELANLPPNTPPELYDPKPIAVPDFIRNRARVEEDLPYPPPPQTRQSSVFPSEEDYQSEYEATPTQTPAPLPKSPSNRSAIDGQSPMKECRDERPDVMPHDQAIDDDQQTQWSMDDVPHGDSRRLPPPQPVDLPTPVRSPGQFPASGPQMRPPFGPGMVPGMGMPPMMPPGAGEMPRPTMPRIAGVRDPISTT